MKTTLQLPQINPEKETQKITQFIKDTLKKQRFKKAVIALSGGVDSTTTLYLTLQALGKQNVDILLLPYGTMSDEATRDATVACEIANVSKSNIQTIDIRSAVDTLVTSLNIRNNDISAGHRVGNIMARIRMIEIFDQAKKMNSLVIGTENKSEHYLGYFTRFGDEASDIEPIRHLYKTQIFELARYLGVPDKVVTKAPTAELWQGQTDEGEFGFTYTTADQILYGLVEKKLSPKQLLKSGIRQSDINRVMKRVEANQFKHHVPILLKK